MGRKSIYNNITSEEKIRQINKKNVELMNDFLDYLSSIDRSPTTLNGYKSDLLIFFCWNVDNNDNKYFVDLTKREVAKFQSYALNTWSWSSNRIRRVKSVMSSLSNYIENILDDEIKNYKPIIRKIENPVNEPVREKTVLTDEQVEFLLCSLIEQKKYQQACAVALAAYCGCRKAEILRFKVSYFDDTNIICDGAMYQTPEKIKTKGRNAKLGKPLIKYTLIDFKKYFDLWMNERKNLGIDSEWLFVTTENNKWVQAKISTMDSYAETCSKILNVPFYFHSLRHFLTTKLSKYNLPSQVIQEYFGWGNIDMISVYNDNNASDDFNKYFTKDGIVSVEEGTINNL